MAYVSAEISFPSDFQTNFLMLNKDSDSSAVTTYFVSKYDANDSSVGCNDLLGYTIIVLAFYFVERLRIAQAQQLAAAELRAKLAQAQLQNLRLQLQPHFLFNTLNTISAVMYQDLGAADAILRQLSDLLRLTLRAANSQEVPLAQELEITRLYLKIMQQRFEEKLRVTYRVAPEFENSLVPQLILQPLVENSLRHGLKNSESGIDIVIAAQRENGTLILRVADTGAGLGRRQSESRRNPARPGPSQHQAADGAALWRRPAAWNCQPIRSTLCPRVPAMHRCSSAKELLNDWTLSLTDVALSCGFADQSHFTRVFNALVGCPPGEWRSRNGGSASVA